MSRIVNELDSIHFSIKKASQLVKEIGRQVNFWNIHSICLFLLLLFVFQNSKFKFQFFLIGCDWQVYHGITFPYCRWSHSHHYCEGMYMPSDHSKIWFPKFCLDHLFISSGKIQQLLFYEYVLWWIFLLYI